MLVASRPPDSRPIRVFRAPRFAKLAVTAFVAAACETPVDPPAAEAPAPFESVQTPVTAIPVPVPGCGEVGAYSDVIPAYPTALYQICWPAVWNGSFIVYAHGYVSEFQDLAIPGEAAGLAAFATSQGFGFASTSYRTNGLAIREGVEDMAALAEIVRAEAASAFPTVPFVPVLITGASEGGAVATLAAERHAGLFQGALSTCGPTGDFQRQLDYLGDFNVLFNYFFPSVFADGNGGFLVTPAGVADQLIQQIEALGEAAVSAQLASVVTLAVAANPGAAAELLRVAGVPVDPDDPASGLSAILSLLRYNVFATNDAIAKLGGTPYDNRWRWYHGSGNDLRLNSRRFGVERYAADPAAKATVAAHYETSGDLEMSYVSMHTTGDQVVEFWQQPRYRLKAMFNGSAHDHSAFPVFRYGHCAFEEGDLTAGLALLMLKVGAALQDPLVAAMPSASAQQTFLDLVSR